MVRPKVTDRAIADETLTIRITSPERRALDELCARRAAELEGTGAVITAAGLVRALIVREAKAVLGGIPAQPPIEPSQNQPANAQDDPRQLQIPTLTPTPQAQISAPKQEIQTPPAQSRPKKVASKSTLVERLKLVKAQKLMSFTKIGEEIVVDSASITKWINEQRPIPSKYEEQLDALLTRLGV